MAGNFLKLKDDKTEFLFLLPARQFGSVSISHTQAGNHLIAAVVFCYLGVMFDTTVSMEIHLNNICPSAMAHLRNIIDIRPSLTKDATAKLDHGLVTSRQDSGNVLLYMDYLPPS